MAAATLVLTVTLGVIKAENKVKKKLTLWGSINSYKAPLKSLV